VRPKRRKAPGILQICRKNGRNGPEKTHVVLSVMSRLPKLRKPLKSSIDQRFPKEALIYSSTSVSGRGQT
jgi:hypothetical protein